MKLSKVRSGFQLIPEGEHILQITKVEDKSKFEKMEVTLKTSDGLSTVNRYNIGNEKGFELFSELIRTAVKDYDSEEIKVQSAVGKFILATVKHTKVESTKNPDQIFTYVNVYVNGESDGWGDEFVEVSEDDEDDDINLLFGDDN